MPRPGYRARLESGLKLNLNWLIRERVVMPGCQSLRPRVISWSRDGEEIATAEILFNMEDFERSYLDIMIGSLDQRIGLVPLRRHFGGRQWFFICPFMNQRAMVLWIPPGARSFSCRQRWGRHVAYASQFLDRDNRAHRGKAKISSRLCRLGDFDPDEWDFPPKPKWMRWATYKRAEEKFDRYDTTLDEGIIELVASVAAKINSRF